MDSTPPHLKKFTSLFIFVPHFFHVPCPWSHLILSTLTCFEQLEVISIMWNRIIKFNFRVILFICLWCHEIFLLVILFWVIKKKWGDHLLSQRRKKNRTRQNNWMTPSWVTEIFHQNKIYVNESVHFGDCMKWTSRRKRWRRQRLRSAKEVSCLCSIVYNLNLTRCRL